MGRRTTIEVEGLHHAGAPIPLAARVGPLLASGSINGQDPQTGEFPEDPADQVALVFANIRRVMAAAGGDTTDIAKLTISVRDKGIRPLIDEQWIAMFPDEHDRPARHLVTADIPPFLHLQAELLAYLG